MSDREASRSPKMDREREHSPRRSREREGSPRKRKSYSRSPSRERKVYRDDRDRSRRRDSRDRSYSRRDRSRDRRHAGTRDNPKPNRCLGVFGLSVHTTEDELYHIFSKYGPVERVQVVIDAKTGRSRGFAFVYYEAAEDAKVAKDQCSGMKIDSKSIRVDFSITERAHTPTPGIYMGRPTYKSDRYDRGWRDSRDDYRSSRYSRRSPSPYYRERRSRREYRSRSRSYSRGKRTRELG